VEHHQRTHWQVRRSSCLCPVSANSRIREEGGTQDWEPLIQQARQQGRRCRANSRSEHLGETISLSRSGLRSLVPPSATKPRKVSGIGLHIPGLHAGVALKSWFCDFLTSCMSQLKIQMIWRKKPIVLIPMPEKSLGDSKSYLQGCYGAGTLGNGVPTLFALVTSLEDVGFKRLY